MDLLDQIQGRREPFTTGELAKLLGVTTRTISVYTSKGWLPAEKHQQDARRLVYPVSGVRAFLKARVNGKAVKS